MIGKLFKFDFRTSIRQISVIWIAAIASSILLSVTLFVVDRFMQDSLLAVALGSITSFIYVAVMVALAVATLLIVVMRFYKGVCDNEGYLLHTLPVTTRSIIISKGLVATAITTISTIVIALSIFFIALGFDGYSVFQVIGECAMEMIRQPFTILLAVEFIVLVIFSMMKSVYQIYASIAVGQLAGKHRVLLSIVAYIAIGTILSTIAVSAVLAANLPFFDMALFKMGMYLENHFTELGFIQLFMFFGFVGTAIQVVIFHFIAEVLLTRKLNLL